MSVPTEEAAQFDFAAHASLLTSILREQRGASWATFWDIYEGMCWLRAFSCHDLQLSIIDPDLKPIAESIARYRIWVQHLET